MDDEGVYQRKDRRVRPKPQSEAQHDERRDAGPREQRTERIPSLHADRVHHGISGP